VRIIFNTRGLLTIYILASSTNLEADHELPTKQPKVHATPPSSAENIFTRISKLNESLAAINPSYKPVGFSITSIDACSKAVLDDAVAATETAVSTLLSVIGETKYT